MEAGRRVQRVSGRQLEILWEFLSLNRDIATAYNRTLQAKEYSKRKWTEIADVLNSQGDGLHKDWRGWTKYWTDLKAKIKKRAAAFRASHLRTGGGPGTEQPMMEMELKFLQLLGEDFGQGLPGVRVEPVIQPLINTAATDLLDEDNSPISESILILSQEPLIPHTPAAQDTEARSTSRTSAHTLSSPPPIITHIPRQRRRRPEPPISQAAARRSLVRSAQMRAESAVRVAAAIIIYSLAVAMEKMVQTMAELQNTAVNIERCQIMKYLHFT